MAIVGPGAEIERPNDVKPTLDGVSEYEYVTILNPLSDDFAVRVAQDVPVNVPYTAKNADGQQLGEAELSTIYGANLRNRDFKAKRRISNDTVIKSGQTVNFKGNEAQVAVRQLVNEILQREGKKRLMADPVLRKEVEDRIIINRGSIQELMDTNLTTTHEQATRAINQSNEVQHENAFPGLKADTGSSGGADPAVNAGGNGYFTTADLASDKRTLGRPKKV